jgi:hypothetical protein
MSHPPITRQSWDEERPPHTIVLGAAVRYQSRHWYVGECFRYQVDKRPNPAPVLSFATRPEESHRQPISLTAVHVCHRCSFSHECYPLAWWSRRSPSHRSSSSYDCFHGTYLSTRLQSPVLEFLKLQSDDRTDHHSPSGGDVRTYVRPLVNRRERVGSPLNPMRQLVRVRRDRSKIYALAPEIHPSPPPRELPLATAHNRLLPIKISLRR